MIIPVILAGGSGTRLWPASRKGYPKQFLSLAGDQSLFQTTVNRFGGPGFAPATVLTIDEHRFMVADQLEEIGAGMASIILEPAARNTGPAILAAALRHAHRPNAVLLVSPSDHRILDEAAFARALVAGQVAAEAGEIVTFGIHPSSPETGFGYIELEAQATPGRAQVVRSFVEKPDATTAETLIKTGKHLWNAGVFMFRVDTILQAFEALAPELMGPCRAAVTRGTEDLGFFRLEAEAYASAKDISIDYAIMEEADVLQAVPVACGWSDLGSWRTIHEAGTQDAHGNVLSESAMQIDCENTLLRSERKDMRLVGVGLDNIAAIATGDAVLIANLDETEKVKDAVAELKLQSAPEAESFKQCHRPWGHYETLALGERFQVKRIMVKPGGCLSLQSHVHRAEHWVVVEGTATVTVGDDVSLLTENQSVYIPLGEVHRLENQGRLPLTLIEVQSGPYLGEDDIIRYEDVYARVPETKAIPA